MTTHNLSNDPDDPPFWKAPAIPQHVGQMFVVDQNHRMLIMHRSDKVRSAKNVWSIPSGTHEVGEPIKSTLIRELSEEYGLIGVPGGIIDQYENIAGDAEPPHYHWVISLYPILVDDVTQAQNREPDKHDKMEFVYFNTISTLWLANHPFHPSLDIALAIKWPEWKVKLTHFINSFGY